ncbi:chloride channel protein [uncultured Chitinophaga sp.]|uniref:chloride channel protein n=1 Tax=uncultured Chitinophaga sp. TaxID=339340 RepID=UPI0025EEDF32|nr:chloride channel protein [uncultured Chitinophaga sp.]
MEVKIPVAPSLDTEADIKMEDGQRAVSVRVLLLSIQVVINAVIIGIIAKGLVLLINLITNLSFYGQFSLEERGPAGNQLGLLVILVPIIGALIIGVMARLGSAAIRGHGIPEAMEQVLTNESRIKPIITLLKPLSAAISIGTGGPFGAEGPIISTGGAFGSFTGQIMRITPVERKIMLTAGATAGMAAIFGTPVAAVLLAIELLLFEFSPRTLIPVSLACATGAAMHLLLFGGEAVFAMPAIPAPGGEALMVYSIMGIVIGIIAAIISKSIYFIEDMFEKLPIHWMWWPAIGAIAIGVVGYFAPYTLGVGYNNISELLTGSLPVQLVLGLCFLKFISWSVSLGSGTSGGTLAPLLTIGGATGLGLGMLIQHFAPAVPINLPTCTLIGMAAMFAGAARALLTSIVFALETTMQPHGLLPLLAACTTSYFISFFMMKGSIMTEKIRRRGVTTPEAYEPDVLQHIPVQEVMDKTPVTANTSATIAAVKAQLHTSKAILVNTPAPYAITADMILQAADHTTISSILPATRVYIYPDSKVSFAAALMHRYGVTALPVVERTDRQQAIGIIDTNGLLRAYNLRRGDSENLQRIISVKKQGYRMYLKGKKRFV